MSKSKDPLNRLTHIKMSSIRGNPQHAENIDDSAVDSIDVHSSNVASPNDTQSKFSVSELPIAEKIQPNNKSDGENSDSSEINNTIHIPIDKVTSNNSANLPRFLTKLQSSFSGDFMKNEDTNPQRALAVVDDNKKSKGFNPNSFGSIFNRDHQEISGIQRVFKKSIAFLLLNLALFGMISLVSINLFVTPLWLTILLWVAFMTVSNIFYIIVADRSYVWLGISGNIILLLLVHSFLGQGFDAITLICAFILIILIFSAYSELEKIQLGSRLFFISHITGETTRVLSTVVSIVLSLGLFSSMVSVGTGNFIDTNFLTNQIVLDRLIIGENKEISLNRIFLKGYKYYGEGNTKFTLRDFLTDNYRGGRTVITESEQTEIIIACEARQTDKVDCFEEVTVERDKRLLDWKQEAYPKINADLETIIGKVEFNQLIREHYIYLINDLTSTQSSLPILPSKYIVPAFFGIVFFAILLIIKPIINWVVMIFTWILWKILKLTGFAKIEVEAVEAEIVSI